MADYEPQPGEKFNVVQFFEDENYEYVRRAVSIEEAEEATKHYCTSVGARLGTTVKVLITDMGDCILFHWEYGKGIIFPSKEDIERAKIR